MAEPWTWDETDIEKLINEPVPESLTLDYKRCAALDKRNPERRTELSKDVSAFANSAGGTLVYGVEENNHIPVRIDDGYDPADVTREWIEQVNKLS
jgi:predicted HTH transcriptional regulator